MEPLRCLGALSATALLTIGLVPFFPTHEYDGRFILLGFANEVPEGAFHFTAIDSLAGDQDLAYVSELRVFVDPTGPSNRTFELAVGEWGPSHGNLPLLPNGYPGPHLEERAVMVNGGPFAVRLWEGVGVQDDCRHLFEAQGLHGARVSGGGQWWGTSGPRRPGGDSTELRGAQHDFWDQPQYLTCAWIEYVGGPPANAAGSGEPQVVTS